MPVDSLSLCFALLYRDRHIVVVSAFANQTLLGSHREVAPSLRPSGQLDHEDGCCAYRTLRALNRYKMGFQGFSF